MGTTLQRPLWVYILYFAVGSTLLSLAMIPLLVWLTQFVLLPQVAIFVLTLIPLVLLAAFVGLRFAKDRDREPSPRERLLLAIGSSVALWLANFIISLISLIILFGSVGIAGTALAMALSGFHPASITFSSVAWSLAIQAFYVLLIDVSIGLAARKARLGTWI